MTSAIDNHLQRPQTDEPSKEKEASSLPQTWAHAWSAQQEHAREWQSTPLSRTLTEAMSLSEALEQQLDKLSQEGGLLSEEARGEFPPTLDSAELTGVSLADFHRAQEQLVSGEVPEADQRQTDELHTIMGHLTEQEWEGPSPARSTEDLASWQPSAHPLFDDSQETWEEETQSRIERRPLNDALIGRQLRDRFLIKELLAEDALGVTYRVTDLLFKGEYACKILSVEEGESEAQRALREKLLKDEFQTAEKLYHQVFERVFHWDIDPLSGRPFYIKECAQGRSLESLLEAAHQENQSGPLLERERALAFSSQLFEALQLYLDKELPFHGFEPAQLLLLEQSSTQAKWLMPTSHYHVESFMEDSFTVELTAIRDVSKTRAALMSQQTFPWKAPEQQGREPIKDERTAVFVLGMLMSRLLLGDRPLEAAPSPREDYQLTAVLQKATQVDPSKRFPTLRSFQQVFEAVATRR